MNVHKKHDEKVKLWQNPIKCEKCWMFFKGKINLRSHIKAVHSTITYECDACGKNIKNKRSLVVHLKTIHNK